MSQLAILRDRLRVGSWFNVAIWTLVPVIVLACAWSNVDLVPMPGLDSSGLGALEFAAHDGVAFGTHAVYTYGPLGFLITNRFWYSDLAELSFAYLLLVRVGLAAALFAAARRTFGVPAAALCAFIVAASVGPVAVFPAEMPVFFLLAVGALERELPRRQAVIASVAAGSFAGFEVLLKLSVGVSLMVLAFIFICGLSGNRRMFLFVGSAAFLLAFVAGWFVSGQDIASLPSYVRNAAEVLIGYGPGESLEQPGLQWQYLAALFDVALGLWGAWQMTALGRARQRSGIVILWLAYSFLLFKEGFDRHDTGHAAICLGGLLAGFVAFRWSRGYRPYAVFGVAALLVILLAGLKGSFTTTFNPDSNAGGLISELGTVISASERAKLMQAGRAQIEATDPIDFSSLALLRDQTVTVYPVEAAIVWAYHLNWDPLPVLQSYVASTPALDRLDADALASNLAPQRIVFSGGTSIDTRVLAFDEGMTSRSLMCRYVPLRVKPAFGILAREPNRCGVTRLLEVVHADWRQAVSIPAPSARALVFVRIGGVGVTGLEELRSVLFKPYNREVVLDGVAHRLVTGTAMDGLPLRAAPGVDFPAPMNLAPDSHSIAVQKDGQGVTGGKPITYSFYSESFARLRPTSNLGA
jgi:hypothetical protein